MNNNAVVFGGTGLVGHDLVAELLNADRYEKVIMVVRSPFPVLNTRIELLQLTDFSKLQEFKSQLQATAFFCCIGTTIKKAGSRQAFREVDLEIPCYIAKLAHDISVPNLVIISSIGANVLSRSFYLRTKGEMESQVRKIFTGNLKIVRPSLLSGNRTEFRAGEGISLFFMKGIGKLLSGSYIKYRSILSRDVAKAMIMAVDLPAEKVILESDELQKMATGIGIK